MRANQTEGMWLGSIPAWRPSLGGAGPIAMTRAPDGVVSPGLLAPELLAAVPGPNGIGAELRAVWARAERCAYSHEQPSSPTGVCAATQL
jgi:hypothetical protein